MVFITVLPNVYQPGIKVKNMQSSKKLVVDSFLSAKVRLFQFLNEKNRQRNAKILLTLDSVPDLRGLCLSVDM